MQKRRTIVQNNITADYLNKLGYTINYTIQFAIHTIAVYQLHKICNTEVKWIDTHKQAV